MSEAIWYCISPTTLCYIEILRVQDNCFFNIVIFKQFIKNYHLKFVESESKIFIICYWIVLDSFWWFLIIGSHFYIFWVLKSAIVRQSSFLGKSQSALIGS